MHCEECECVFGRKYQLREHVGVYHGGNDEGHFYGGEGDIINNEFEETDRFDAVENNHEVPELDENVMSQLVDGEENFSYNNGVFECRICKDAFLE